MSRPATSTRFVPALCRAAGLAGLMAASLLAGPARAQDQDGSFNLINRSNRVIERLYASPTDTADWGENRLAGGRTLANEGNLAVRMAPDGGCRTDLRIAFAGGMVEERRDIDTCLDRDVVIGTPARTGAQRAGREDGQAGDPSFNLINEAASPIREFYASPTNEDDWGDDRLGGGTVRARGRRAIRLPGGHCRFDLRVVWEDGRAEERRDVNLCEIQDLSFR
jgi:hypothetical protein